MGKAISADAGLRPGLELRFRLPSGSATCWFFRCFDWRDSALERRRLERWDFSPGSLAILRAHRQNIDLARYMPNRPACPMAGRQQDSETTGQSRHWLQAKHAAL